MICCQHQLPIDQIFNPAWFLCLRDIFIPAEGLFQGDLGREQCAQLEA